MNYTNITEEERYQIYELRQEGFTLEAIGIVLGRDKSTISPELRRNKGERGYRPKQAQAPRSGHVTAPMAAGFLKRPGPTSRKSSSWTGVPE